MLGFLGVVIKCRYAPSMFLPYSWGSRFGGSPQKSLYTRGRGYAGTI